MKIWNRLSYLVLPLIFGAVFLGFWLLRGEAMESSGEANGLTPRQAEARRQIILPYPGEIFAAIGDEWETIRDGARSTFVAAFFGFLAASVGGYAMALILASSVYINRGLYPWVLILQMTPVVILAPIISIWVTSPPLAPVILVTFLIGFFPVVANSTLGLVSVERNLLDVFEVCNATKAQELLHLRIPFSLPYFLTGMKIAGTLAPIGAITGDIFVGTAEGDPGLGYLTILFKQTTKSPALFGTALIACLMGFVFVGLVNLIHWWALHKWHDSMVRKK